MTDQILNNAFWAMNYNMAVNNLLTVIRYISCEEHPTNLDRLDEKNAILNSTAIRILNVHKDRIKTQRTMQLLIRHLPFLGVFQNYYAEPPKTKDGEEKKPLRQLSPEEMANFLCYCATLLISIRNSFSHSVHEGYTLQLSGKYPDERYRKALQNIFDADVRTAKNRFYAQTSDDKEADSRANQDWETDIFNEYRRFRGWDNKTNKPRENSHYRFRLFEEDGKHFTKNWGLAFFVALFLEPAHASMMMDQVSRCYDLSSNASRRSSSTSDQIGKFIRQSNEFLPFGRYDFQKHGWSVRAE